MPKLLLAFLALIGLTLSAQAAQTIDACVKTADNGTHGSNIATTALLTAVGANEVLIVFVGHDKTSGGATTVSSVTDNVTGLTYTRRGTQFTQQLGSAGTAFVAIDEFYAVTGATFSGAISAYFAATIDNGWVVACLVTASNTTTPFDTNVAVPATGSLLTNTSAVPTVAGVSTTCDKTMIFQVVEASSSSNLYSTPQTNGSGFAIPTNGNIAASGGTYFSDGALQYKVVAATQSSVSTAFAVSWTGWISVTDALQDATASCAGGGSTFHGLPLLGAGK
jgi:hypothetical protein